MLKKTLPVIASLALLALSVAPQTAMGQGGMDGGLGGGGGGRGGGRGGRRGGGENGPPADTAAIRARLENETLADVALAHRTGLRLSDSQSLALSGIRARANESRGALASRLAAARIALENALPPAGTSLSDSARKVIVERRHSVSAAMGDLHDVDVTARNETLKLLDADQQEKVLKLESAGQSQTDESRRGRQGEMGRGRG